MWNVERCSILDYVKHRVYHFTERGETQDVKDALKSSSNRDEFSFCFRLSLFHASISKHENKWIGLMEINDVSESLSHRECVE
jgi:hypothetical protein